MKTIIVDMDDIALSNALNNNPDANGLNYAYYLKGKFPQFKITLFTIPGRSTIPWMQELSKISWIRLAMHGFHHDESEEITQPMLEVMEPFTKIYKGPNWKVTGPEKDLLFINNWTLAVKEKLPEYPGKQWPLTDPRVFHGHCWIKGDWERLESLIEPDTEFKFIEEVI